MDFQELNRRHLQVIDHIGRKQVKDALDGLEVLCNFCHNKDLRTQLENHRETYANILKYSFELADDPEKEKVYLRMVKAISALSDDMKEDIIRSGKLLRYYDLSKYDDRPADLVFNDLISRTEHMRLEEEAGIDSREGNESGSTQKTILYKESISAAFSILLLSDKLRDYEITLLKHITSPGGMAWYHKSILVSALTLSLIRHFDMNKVDLLFGFYETGENQIWQRALVGLVLALAFYDNRIENHPEILQHLKAIQGAQDSDQRIEMVIIQFIKAWDTEKITRKIQQEIIPEMIKIKSRLEEKLDLENLLSSSDLDEKNPEWETFFKESPDVYGKLEEFTHLQMEGADVFLGAFAMLKRFDFFREMENWFLPFYKENEDVSEAFSGGGEGFDQRQLALGIERSGFLCNSDKYSFCLNVKQMAPFQKSTIMELFNMELKAMNEMAADDEIVHAEARDRTIITQYFQDLYRFYKLHPLRGEFDDLFNLSKSLYDARFFKAWINDIHVLRNIGEFFFEKNYYKDALMVFMQVTDQMKSYELQEKIGYCHQQLEDFEHALEAYHKAELFGKPKIWLQNKIAYCARKSGDHEGAVKYYREAEKMEPENLEIQAFLGQTLMETEKYGEALRYYFKVEYLQPENYKVYRPISWCSFMEGKFETAIKYLEKAIDRNATKHDHLNMGHIYWCMGRKQEAIQSYRQSLVVSNRDAKWFSKVLADDSKFLVQKGISRFDISLMNDYIRMSLQT